MKQIERLGPVSLDGLDRAALLRHWEWLVPLDFQTICVTRLGDVFLQDPHGSVWFLDAGAGTFEMVAGSVAAWSDLLHDDGRLKQWSAEKLIERLEAAGLRLGSGQCYTYWQSPIMGGTYEPANFKVVDVQKHFDIWGPLLGSLKDLPDGTRVQFVVKP
jgi:hypothetical protein